MGISAFVMFERGKSISIERMLQELKEECEKSGLYFKLSEYGYELGVGGIRMHVVVDEMANYDSDNKDTALYMDFYEEPNKFNYVFLDEYDDIELFQAIIINRFSDREKLLLKFLYIVLKKYPHGIAWPETDWIYTLEDLEKIVKKPYDEDWFIKNLKKLI